MQEEKLKGQAVKILLNFTNKLSSTFAYNGFITKERKDLGGIFCCKNGHVYQHTAISLADSYISQFCFIEGYASNIRKFLHPYIHFK